MRDGRYPIGFDETPEADGRCPYTKLYRIAEGESGPVIQEVDTEDWYTSKAAAQRALRKGKR